MPKRLRQNNNSKSNSKKTNFFYEYNFLEKMSKKFNRNNVSNQYNNIVSRLTGYNSKSNSKKTQVYGSNNNTKSTATSKITKTKKPRKQSTPKKSPNK